MNRMTKPEKTAIIGYRAMQISLGSPLFINPGDETDSTRIALLEFYARVIPYKIKRKYPDGSEFMVDINDLIQP